MKAFENDDEDGNKIRREITCVYIDAYIYENVSGGRQRQGQLTYI